MSICFSLVADPETPIAIKSLRADYSLSNLSQDYPEIRGGN